MSSTEYGEDFRRYHGQASRACYEATRGRRSIRQQVAAAVALQNAKQAAGTVTVTRYTPQTAEARASSARQAAMLQCEPDVFAAFEAQIAGEWTAEQRAAGYEWVEANVVDSVAHGWNVTAANMAWCFCQAARGA